MAKAGDELINPVTGLRTVFHKTARDTDGELLQMEWIGKPGWSAGPRHVHPLQEERFEVLSGRLRRHVEGGERDHGPGDVIVVPPGSVHTLWNVGDEELHALVEFRPALRSEVVFETLAGLERDGRTNKAGIPKNPLRLALLLREYEDEIYLVRPPLSVQRAVFGVLASVGQLLGYQTEYPYPYGDQDERTSTASGVRKVAVVTVLVFLVPLLLRRLRRQSGG